MVRPLKYGEKTSVRSVTIPDSMWEALPEPRSQWVVESVRQFLEVPFTKDAPEAEGAPVPTSETIKALTEEVKASSLELIVPPVEMTPNAVQALVDKLPEPIRSEVPDNECSHPKGRQVNVMGGRRCLDCGKLKPTNGVWG